MAELIILLPTRNEEKGLAEVIDRIPRKIIESEGYILRVVVVDGYSSDTTCEIAESKGAELINQSGSIGKGNGVRQALDTLLEDKQVPCGDLLIMLDADATYFPEDIPRFIQCLGDNDVVWGSRLKGEIEELAMSQINKLGNTVLSLAASILFLKRTTDLCTGYWGFRIEALKELKLTADGFNLEADLFSSVVKRKMRMKEIPIKYAHREGYSTLKWYRDGPRIFLMTLRKGSLVNPSLNYFHRML